MTACPDCGSKRIEIKYFVDGDPKQAEFLCGTFVFFVYPSQGVVKQNVVQSSECRRRQVLSEYSHNLGPVDDHT